MVLIPPDIGLRVRLQNELQPQPVTPLQEIPSELPELKAGQAFSARIQEVLPENTYRALVAGKSITLSLPESVKSGDVLDLVVIDRTPRTIIAQLAISGKAPGTAGDAAYPHATFSRVGQMISALLAPEGQAPPAAELNQGQPLLAQPPKSGAELVPALSKAVVESGLFYEAHQAQWIAGKLPLGSLLQEPQGQYSQPEAQLVAYAEKMLLASLPTQSERLPSAQDKSAASTAEASPGLPGQPATPAAIAAQTAKTSLHGLLHDVQGQPVTLAQIAAYLRSEVASPEQLKNMSFQQLVDAASMLVNFPQPQEAATENHAASENQRAPANPLNNPPAALPDELLPLVQQQLDAAGTQRLLWHGEVWPGQTMQWQVEWNGERRSDSNQGEAEPWSTTLRLTTPRLGEVEAALRLGANGVHIALIS
ncbi:MAG: hypothetical protein WC100_21705, partial [Sterolibacterium sp.]